MRKDDVHVVVVLPWFVFGHLIPFFNLSIALAEVGGDHVLFISTPRNIKTWSLQFQLDYYHNLKLNITTINKEYIQVAGSTKARVSLFFGFGAESKRGNDIR